MKHVPTMLVTSILLVFGAGASGVLQAQTVPPPSPEPPIHTVAPQQDQSQQPMNRHRRLITQPHTQTRPDQPERRHYRLITQQHGQDMTNQKQASSHDVNECNKVTARVLQSLKGGNLNAAKGHLGRKLRHRMNVQLLQQRWKSLTAKYGDVQKIGQANNGQEIRNLTVIAVPVKFQKGKIDARAMCDTRGRLASLRLGGMPDNDTSGQH